MNKAFVLGAGLGTRLRPLTDQLPKPLIPVINKPLIAYAFDHLLGAGVQELIVNTHHLPGKYPEAFPSGSYRGAPLTFRHEPVLLETAGGIANIADLVQDAPFVVYNGDILTNLPLSPLIEEHGRGQNLVTLVLRSSGPALHLAWDAATGLITDIRNQLGTGNTGTHLFTGIYAVSPEFLRHLTPGKIESVIPIFLKLISAGERIGAVVVDEGEWWDLGNRNSYLQAHDALLAPGSPFSSQMNLPPPIAADAVIHPGAELRGWNAISSHADVGADSVLENCILWPDARVASGTTLKNCIVRSGMTASGTLRDVDV